MELKLVQHLVVNMDGSLPEIPDCLYTYIMAGNGVFIYAKRPGLETLIPVCACTLAGLPELMPWIHITKRMPKFLLEEALRFCQQVLPNEALCWFRWNDEWSSHFPQQQTTNTSAMPRDRHDRAGTRALIDLHSHASFAPFFSHADDRDEIGFRIYAVIGNLDRAPTISVRVGVYSHYFYIPAATVFELPDGIQDSYEQEDIKHEVE